jgi:hypothetical protein
MRPRINRPWNRCPVQRARAFHEAGVLPVRLADGAAKSMLTATSLLASTPVKAATVNRDPLVDVEDVRPAVTSQDILQRLDAERRFHGDRETPRTGQKALSGIASRCCFIVAAAIVPGAVSSGAARAAGIRGASASGANSMCTLVHPVASLPRWYVLE